MPNSERIFTYAGPADVPYEVQIDFGKTVDFTPIIMHPLFKRLRFVGQLKPIDLIFSGATHSRREHSLGVFYIAQKVARRSIEESRQQPPYISMTDYERFLFLSYSLLHDIGHGPLSHLFEIVSTAYGHKDHKERGLDVIKNCMNETVEKVAKEHFEYNHPVEDICRMVGERHPLVRLISDKDRLDKWDFVDRDWHYCQAGSVPDLETMITNLHFDGKSSAIYSGARDALRAFLEALVNNNTSIYMKPEVEISEGLLIRAILAAVKNGVDMDAACSFTDSGLYQELMKYGPSKEIVQKVEANDFLHDSRWVTIASIKPSGYGWIERDNNSMLELSELTKEELDKLQPSLSLPSLIKLEEQIMGELNLEPYQMLITYSPQIDRLKIDDSNILIKDGGGEGGYTIKSIFDVSPGLADYLTGRLYEHYTIRLAVDRRAAGKVRGFVKSSGGFPSLLMK